MGRSPRKIDHSCFFFTSLLCKASRIFLLRKHCKEGGNCHNPFLGSSKLHCFFSLKKKNRKLKQCRFERHCSLSPLQMQRQGRRRFLKYFLPALSLHPTCPKIPHDPYPHLHNHTLQLPRHHALHLDRVWWTSPPAAYKYRGENRTMGGGTIFLRKRGTTVCRCCHHRHLSTASSSTQSLLLQVTPSPHLCFFVSLLACRTCTVHVSASKQNN